MRTGGVAIPKILIRTLSLLLDGGLPRDRWKDEIMQVGGKSIDTARRKVRETLEEGFVTEDKGLCVLTPHAWMTLT